VIDRVRTINPAAEIFVSTVGEGGLNEFGGAAKDPEFAAKVRDFLAHYGLNGIDIDWEMGLDKANLSLLVSNLAVVLHPAGYKLTLAGWSWPSYAYDMNVLKDNLDQINIMSYGRGTTLKSCVEQYVSQGFPVEKLIGGVETEVPYHQSGGTDSLGPDGTLAQKANYAVSNGLAGMMEWRLDNDYPEENNLNYPTYKGANELWEIMTAQNHSK
jgi:GH18 family chitinase